MKFYIKIPNGCRENCKGL